MARNAKVFLLLMVMALLLQGCDVPTDQDVQTYFEKAHPNTSIISIGVGDGDAHHVYFYVHYKKNRGIEYIAELLYYKSLDSGQWRVREIGHEKIEDNSEL